MNEYSHVLFQLYRKISIDKFKVFWQEAVPKSLNLLGINLLKISQYFSLNSLLFGHQKCKQETKTSKRHHKTHKINKDKNQKEKQKNKKKEKKKRDWLVGSLGGCPL